MHYDLHPNTIWMYILLYIYIYIIFFNTSASIAGPVHKRKLGTVFIRNMQKRSSYCSG